MAKIQENIRRMVRKLTPTRIRQKVSVEEVLRARNRVEHDCETKRYVPGDSLTVGECYSR